MFYVQRHGHVEGPISAKQLKALAQSYEIELNTLIRKGEQGRWIEASRIHGLFDGVDVDALKDAALHRGAGTDAHMADAFEDNRAGSDEFSSMLGGLPDAPRRASNVTTSARKRRSHGGGASFFGSGSETEGEAGGFNDFVQFRRFLTPELFAAAFWLLTALLAFGIVLNVLYSPVAYFYYEDKYAWRYLLNALAGVLAWVVLRVYAEVIVLFFRIYGVLYEIRSELPKLSGKIDDAVKSLYGPQID